MPGEGSVFPVEFDIEYGWNYISDNIFTAFMPISMATTVVLKLTLVQE